MSLTWKPDPNPARSKAVRDLIAVSADMERLRWTIQTADKHIADGLLVGPKIRNLLTLQRLELQFLESTIAPELERMLRRI